MVDRRRDRCKQLLDQFSPSLAQHRGRVKLRSGLAAATADVSAGAAQMLPLAHPQLKTTESRVAQLGNVVSAHLLHYISAGQL